MHKFNSVSLPTSTFVEGEPDNDENAGSPLTPHFPPAPRSQHQAPRSQHQLTNFQRRSSPEAFESRNNFSPTSWISQIGAPVQRNLKWAEQSLVSPVDSPEELLWQCRVQRCPDPEEVAGSTERRCGISKTRGWPDGAHLANQTPDHEEHSEVQTGHYRWSEPSSLLRTYRPVDNSPFQETSLRQSPWTPENRAPARREEMRKLLPPGSQVPRRLFGDSWRNEQDSYGLLSRYTPELNPILAPSNLSQGRLWSDSCDFNEFSPELFPRMPQNQGSLSERKSSPTLPRLTLSCSPVGTRRSNDKPLSSRIPIRERPISRSAASSPLKKLNPRRIPPPPPRPQSLVKIVHKKDSAKAGDVSEPQSNDSVRDSKVPRKPKLYSVFWRNGYNLKKKAGKDEVVTRTRVLKRGGKLVFEKYDKLKRDPKTKKFCFVFTIPPGPAAKFMIYVMANRYKESCELQRRYNCWLHIDLLFNTEDPLEDYEGLVTLKWQNDTHVYSLARRILEIINTKLKGINVVAIDPPLNARTQIRDKLLHMSTKLIKRIRTELRCFFHIVLLREENVTRIIVGGLNKQRLERGLKELLQVINPEIQKKYTGGGFVIREVGGEVKLGLELLSSFKK